MEPVRPLHVGTARAALRGYTLVETIVVLAIIVIITAIAVIGQSTFNRSLLLTDTAYSIAFTVRQAQTYGLSSRKYTASGTQYTNAGYGVHLDNDDLTHYELYADIYPAAPGSDNGGLCPGHSASAGSPDAKPGNCIQNVPQGETVQKYTLNRGFSFLRFCGNDDTQVYRCSDDKSLQGTPHQMDRLDITFLRPNTQAVILATTEYNGTFGQFALSNAVMYLQSPDKTMTKCVTVSKVGEVAVGDCP